VRAAFRLKTFLIASLSVLTLAVPIWPQSAGSGQAGSGLPDAPAAAQGYVPRQSLPGYTPATETENLHNYLWEAFGPYPLVITAFITGYHQARHNPPDWREGAAGYGERYASDFSVSAINVSTRYTLAEAMDEDVYYYRCDCSGLWPRLRHAVVSVVVARNRITGRQAFALPGLIAPYAGPLIATSTWYPSRYSPKDGFRMGNYGLVDYAIGNIGLEFLPSLTRNKGTGLVKRLHLDNRHAAANALTNP
jgi:hypothetical protein